MLYFEAISRDLPGPTEENHINAQLDQPVSGRRFVSGMPLDETPATPTRRDILLPAKLPMQLVSCSVFLEAKYLGHKFDHYLLLRDVMNEGRSTFICLLQSLFCTMIHRHPSHFLRSVELNRTRPQPPIEKCHRQPRWSRHAVITSGFQFSKSVRKYTQLMQNMFLQSWPVYVKTINTYPVNINSRSRLLSYFRVLGCPHRKTGFHLTYFKESGTDCEDKMRNIFWNVFDEKKTPTYGWMLD
jgi:hypothetical protein